MHGNLKKTKWDRGQIPLPKLTRFKTYLVLGPMGLLNASELSSVAWFGKILKIWTQKNGNPRGAKRPTFGELVRNSADSKLGDAG